MSLVETLEEFLLRQDTEYKALLARHEAEKKEMLKCHQAEQDAAVGYHDAQWAAIWARMGMKANPIDEAEISGLSK